MRRRTAYIVLAGIMAVLLYLFVTAFMIVDNVSRNQARWEDRDQAIEQNIPAGMESPRPSKGH